MTYVVTEACIKCKYTDCVEVCPVDCFYEGPNSLVIDPDECIDCTLCVAECPVNAIYAEDDLPEDEQSGSVLTFKHFVGMLELTPCFRVFPCFLLTPCFLTPCFPIEEGIEKAN